MKRTTYTAKFKADCVLEVLHGNQELGEIAIRHNINPSMLRGWKREFLDNAAKIFGESRREKEMANETLELTSKYEEVLKIVGQLTLERDWLKKKSAEVFGPEYEKKFYRKQQ
jgi:transposase-like protein